MKKLTKKILSTVLAAAMVVTMIPMGAFVAEAATTWTTIASSNFCNATITAGTTNGDRNYESLGYLPTYNGGSAMSWGRYNYVGWGTASASLSGSDNALYIPDGFIYLDGYSEGCVPITGTSRWKIDVGFRFKTTNSGDDKYYSDGSDRYSFLKMYVFESDLSRPNRKNAAYCYFSQNANGVGYSWEDDGHNVGTKSQATSITTGNGNLDVNTNYHYVAEFTGNYFRAYITDDNGTVVQNIINTNESTFISRLKNCENHRINSIKLGDDDDDMYFKGLEYRNITFYRGTEVADASTAGQPNNNSDKYVMAYFTGNYNLENESIRYAVSEDGINYHTLNKGIPVAKINNPTGLTVYPTGTAVGANATGHVRDPYILRKQDGSGFFVLATDLDTGANGFNNNSKFLVWEIERLEDISTTTPWVLDIRSLMTSVYKTDGDPYWIHRAWAPEAFYDAAKGKYFMHFSSRANDYAADSGTYLYGVYTSDFKSFDSTPKRLISTGADNIDASINYNSSDDLYYMWYKNESNSKLWYATATNAEGPYFNQSEFDYRLGVEGPEVFRNLSNNGWIFLCDAFGESADPATSKQGVFQAFTSSTINGFDINNPVSTNISYLYARHAGVTRVTNSEYEALISAYGGMVSDDKVEIFFTGNTSWSGSGWLGSVKDPSEHSFKIMGDSSASYSSHVETVNGEDTGVLTLTNCNAFFQSDDVRTLLKGDSYTVNFKVKITDSSKLSSDIPIAAISNINTDFIKATTSGKFYLDGQTVENVYSLEANQEYDFAISYNGTTASLFIDGEYVTGLVHDDKVVDPAGAQCYLSLGWSDQSGTSRISAKYRDLTIVGTHLDTSAYDDEVMEDYFANAASSSLSDVESHISAYTSKMNGTVYKNMANAYSAYVKVNRMLDAYNYANDGETKVSAMRKLLEADAELTAANAAMTEWTTYSGTLASGAADSSYSANALSNDDAMNNVLFTYGVGSGATSDTGGNMAYNSYSSEIHTQYGAIVFLYDGNTMSCPVNMFFHNGGAGNNKLRYIIINGTPNFWLSRNWNGTKSGPGYQTAWDYQTSYTTTESTIQPGTNSTVYLTNTLYSNLNPGNTYTAGPYYVSYRGQNNKDKYGDVTSSAPIYYVNYSYYMSQVKALTALTDVDVTNYKEGGMLARLQAYDTATSYDPRTELNNGTSTDVGGGVDAISASFRTNISTITSSTKTSDHDYATLRSRFDSYTNSSLTGFTTSNAKQLYASADVNATTVENYDAFVTAYDAAATHMEGLMSDSYHYETMTALATNLKNAIDNLVIIDRSAFNAKVTQANEIISTLTSGTQVYTTSGIENLRDTLLPSYQSACLAATSNALVGTQTTNLTNAINALVENANSLYTALDTAYVAGDMAASGLVDNDKVYSKAGVKALVDAIDAATEAHAIKSATRLDTAKSSVETDLTGKTNAITTATTALDNTAIDILNFTTMKNKLTNLDNDAYEDTKGSIATQLRIANSSFPVSTVSYGGGTISVIGTDEGDVSQSELDAQTGTMLTALNGSIRQYKIYATGADISVSGNVGTYFSATPSEIDTETALGEGHEGYKGKGTYGVRLTFDSNNANTAWYMSYDSALTGRSEQYLGYGESVQTRVQGNMHVRAVKKSSDAPNLITISRNYSDNSSTHGIQLRTYAGSTYTLPEAPAIAYYEFQNYTYNGNTYNAGDVISGINNKNTVIQANYLKAVDNAYTVKVSTSNGDGDIYNASASYNKKIEGTDASAYGWVKVDGGKETMFYVGNDLTYFVTDSIELKAVTSKPAGYTGEPVAYLRECGLVKTSLTDGSGKTKLTINGNYVSDGFEIVEYGVLLGKATTGTITNDDLVVENSGAQAGYSVLRAKATKTVGANQFTISVKVPSSFGAFSYRAYVMYKKEGQITTAYSDVVNDSI